MNDDPIRPCPFCGEAEELIPSFTTPPQIDYTEVAIACGECGAAGPGVEVDQNNRGASLAEARQKWNARKL